MRLLLVSVALLASAQAGNNKYWWMNKDVFGGSNGGGSSGGSSASGGAGCCGGHDSNQGQGQNNYQPQQSSSGSSYQPQQQSPGQSSNNHNNNNNNNNNNPGFGGNSNVQTECPAGTKCVGDFFCDENAIMVNYRVDLSPAQKRNRGNLLPCMNQQTGQFDVCCSTASPGSQGNNRPSSQGQQNQPSFQGQQNQPSFQGQSGSSQNNNNPGNNQISNSIPQGSCPNIGALPDIASCNGMKSNCWSVGQADVDCPNNALCCFDGCRNACYFGAGNGNAPPPRPAPQQSNNRPAPQQSNNRPAPQQSNNRPAPAPQQSNNRPAPAPQPSFNPPPQEQQSQSFGQANAAPQQDYVDPPPLNTPPPRQNPPPRPAPPRPQPQSQPRPEAQQQQQSQSFGPTDDCPNMSPLPSADCAAERDTCWNTGKRDDCARGFLCCYDGCSKTCLNTQTGDFLRHPQSQLSSNTQAGSPPAQFQPQPAPNRPRNNNNRGQNQNNFRQPAQSNNNNNNFGQPAPQNGNNFGQPAPQNSNNFGGSSAPAPQNSNNFGSRPAPAPQNNYSPSQQSSSNQQNSRPQRPSHSNGNIQFPQQSQNNPVRRPSNNNNNNNNNFNRQPAPQQSFKPQSQGSQSNFGGNNPQSSSDEKPFVMCPSAMLCVPRETCDLKGFITTTPLNLTPQLEMLRVATITCVNPDNQNIDICCRDPNYQDPWPGGMMNGGGNNGGNNGGGGFGGNQGFNNGNGNQFQGQQPAQNNGNNHHSGSSNNGGGKRRGGYGKKEGVRSPDRFFFSFLGENVESGSVAREVSPSPSENVRLPSVSSPLK
eukprot:maker-scaffold230_size244653-snap-gene-0.16 protein:Tk08243 transcript:maker-scaffold230_size244653-snap-gene-0.16-mRNA-1 annotation:"serine proteinase stubble-like"